MRLSDKDLETLKIMNEIEFDFESWNYSQYNFGCFFTKDTTDLTISVSFHNMGSQIDISSPGSGYRLGVRTYEPYLGNNNEVLFRNKVYGLVFGNIIITENSVSEIEYELLSKVLSKLDQHKDAWKLFWREDNDSPDSGSSPDSHTI
ncbi:hypothetical protein GAP32_452 [Cronobacter phage vB_CsaM_GAP32]|uniref:Uncharacterized protein n=1 Tax=Cronobacter phage vB_CsaM_GAP32 TaxID=1141136 RepID=K4F784_9CAUD|nr:hypothetical protein GAP32_452 [Cronobacter phage vB_CsaM_GAP32]AFC21908.1 hypothetical protein GAP32_452 [Cronobacter phage vB_CsaM_GAP32]